MTVQERQGSRGEVATLTAISALRGIRDNLRMVVWQPFVLSLGVPMSSLGGLESLLDFTRIAVQPIFGGASDAYGRKSFMVLGELLMVAGGVLFLLAGSWHLLVVGVVLTGLSFAIIPVWNAIVAEMADPPSLGFIYGVIGSGYMAAGLVATLAAGFMADLYGYPSVYLMTVGVGLLCLLLVWLRLRETKARGDNPNFRLSQIVGSLVGAMRPNRSLMGFYVAMSVDLFAFSMGHRLLYGMLTESYGYTPSMLGILSAAMTCTMAVFQIPLGKIVDRAGYVLFLALSQMISCGLLWVLLVSKDFWVVLGTQATMGFSAAFWMPAEQAWIAKNVDPHERARAIGGYSTFRGLFAFPAPFIGGVLFDAFGFDVPILLNLVLAIVDVSLILTLVRESISR